MGYSEQDLRAMAAQARALAASLIDPNSRGDFLTIAIQLEKEADAAPDRRQTTEAKGKA
jgi:hypothetical protein